MAIFVWQEENMYKQVIIVRKDLNMSHGKMAAQVSHASMAFLLSELRKHVVKEVNNSVSESKYHYRLTMPIEKGIVEEWINGAFVKTILEAKTKGKLLKVIDMADSIGLVNGVDYFLIYDNCYTELTPEEENGTTLTCIGFKPMDADIIDKIGKKYQLYKE